MSLLYWITQQWTQQTPHEGEVEKDHLPQPDGNDFPNVPQSCGLSLPQGCIAVSWSTHLPLDPHVLLCKTGSQLVIPQPILLHGVICPQKQDLAFNFVELCGIPVSPFLLVDIPLNDTTLPSFVYEDVTGDRVESRTKIKLNTHCSFLIHGATHLTVRVYQAGQAWFTLYKSLMSTPNNLPFLDFNLCLGNWFPTLGQPQQ